jgi:protein-L-isoaspartate(D-aspartate) O-methyltransferase
MGKAVSKNRDAFIKTLKKNRIRKGVLEAVHAVRQEDFFDPMFVPRLYTDESIPIGFGQASDPPLSLARMLSRLAPQRRWRVLEVGTGSGYSAALLASMVSEVVTVEILDGLAVEARDRLRRLRKGNIRIFSGDGTVSDGSLGHFDAIIVLAACRKRPLSLLSSLKPGSSIIFPMGPEHQQQIALLKNEISGGEERLFKMSFHEFCLFPPIQGAHGYP